MLKLDKSQVRIMLDYCGVPLGDQPKKTSQVRDLLRAFETSDYESYQRAYSLIVDYDTGGKEIVNKMDYNDAARLIAETVKSLEKTSTNTLDNFFMKNLKEMVAELKENYKEAVERESKKFNTIKIQVGDKEPKSVKGIIPENFKRLCQLAQSRINILLVGPSGSGKTFLASQIAEALDLDYASQSCSAGMSESTLSGWLIPIEEGGQFVYVSSEFVRIYENGGVFLFDELDASDPNVLVFLNQALANDGFHVPQRFEKPFVKKHKDFVAIGAANTNGAGADEMYHGRNALDEATLDRFRLGTVVIDYSPKVEQALIDPVILQWGLDIRDKIKYNKLKRLMSTRVLLDAQKMHTDHGWTISDFEQGYFSSWSLEELRIIGKQHFAVAA